MLEPPAWNVLHHSEIAHLTQTVIRKVTLSGLKIGVCGAISRKDFYVSHVEYEVSSETTRQTPNTSGEDIVRTSQ